MIKSAVNLLASRPRIFIWLRRILENNFKEQKKVLKEYFNVAGQEEILDIGCGTGEFSVFFNQESYTGIDIDEIYIDYAKKHYGGKFLVGDAVNLPFLSHSFDRIMIQGVLHHLDSEFCLRIFREMKRVLKPGAPVLIMEDVVSDNDSVFTKILHNLDKGRFIRRAEEYYKMLEPHFKIVKSFKIKSGLCPYQVFLLENKNE